jgi:putative transposase
MESKRQEKTQLHIVKGAEDIMISSIYLGMLIGIPERTAKSQVASGKFIGTIKAKNDHTYMIPLISLPEEAQARYWRMQSGGASETAIGAYYAVVGEDGMKMLDLRLSACRDCEIIDSIHMGSAARDKKEELAASIGVSLRTLYRWQSRYNTQGIAGLFDKTESALKGRSSSLCPLAQDFIKAQVCVPQKPTNRAVHRKLLRLAESMGANACKRCAHCEGTLSRANLTAAGYKYEACAESGSGIKVTSCVSGVDRYVRTIPQGELALGRYGQRYWEAHYMPKAKREKPELVNECLFGDHHLCDLFVLDDDGRIIRPWITAWSEAKSGCFVGIAVTDKPNSRTIAESLIRACMKTPHSPFHGNPSMIYIDNGKDYRGKRMEGDKEVEYSIGQLNASLSKLSVVQAMGIGVTHALPYKAWSKIIERLFGTLENCYFRDLPGWCGNSPQNRPQDLTRASLEKLATRGKLLTIREFEQKLRADILPAYHAERFDKELSPMEIYESSERARPDDIAGADMLGLLRTSVAERKVSPQGVKLDGVLYWQGAMTKVIDSYVTVRYDEDDDSCVTIIKDGHYLCTAPQKVRLKLIGESQEKVGAHMALQKQTAKDTATGIKKAQKAAAEFFKNTIYEDITDAAPGMTTPEYRKAAKDKEALKESRREKKEERKSEDAVREMFLELGKQASRDIAAREDYLKEA